VQKFNIVPNSGENDKSIDHLQEMTINENCFRKLTDLCHSLNCEE
jgi:hypothetical protein